MRPFPFETLSPAGRRYLFRLSLVAVVLLTLALNAVGARLTTAPAPFGIVSYELAGSLDAVQAILASWDTQAQIRAAFSLGLDYVYMLAYPAALSLACLWAAGRLGRARSPLAGWGRSLAWGQWLAGILDACENLALVLLLFGSHNLVLPPLAAACATGKFLLILTGLGYAGLGLAAGERR